MRRSKKALLSTLSFLSLMVAASASYAYTPNVREFGWLRPAGHWKIGVVDDQGGGSYCAMVNQFDKETVLALSRNGDGDGSLALDFHNMLFSPGAEYEVSLQIDGDRALIFPARASSGHSVVVQIGQNKNFIKSLTEGDSLKVQMDVAEARFMLPKLSEAYASLQDCAATLHAGPATAAVPVPDVDKQPLAGADKSLQDQFEKQKQEVAELESKQREQQLKQDALKQAVDLKDKEIARLEEAQKEQSTARSAEMDKQAQEMAQRVAQLQKERDILRSRMEAAQVDKAAQDSLKAKEAELAAALKEQTRKSEEMSRLLNTTQSDYKAKLVAAESERAKLRQKLDMLTAENVPLKARVDQAVRELSESRARVASLETSLSSATVQKEALSARVEAQDAQARELQQALSTKERELLSVRTELSTGSEKLTQVQSELNSLVVEKASVVDRLQTELKKKEAQYNTLKGQLDAQNQALPQTFKMAAELATKKNEVADLQRQLSQIELDRNANAEHAQKKQQELMSLAKTQAAKIAAVQAERDALQARLAALEGKGRKTSQSQYRNDASVSRAAPLFGGPQRPSTGSGSDPSVSISTDVLTELSPGAGDNAPVPLTGPAASGSSAKDFLDKIMSYHRPVGVQPPKQAPDMPVAPVASPAAAPAPLSLSSPTAADKVTLEGLLNASGAAISNFVPVEQNEGRVLSRWTAGKVSGMYEEVASTGNFQEQAAAYIDRYRQDCGDALKVRVSSPEMSGSEAVVVADIECDMPSNSYVTSFLFMEDESGFSAIIHTSYPAEKDAIRGIRDTMLQALKKSSGFEAPQVMQKAAAPAQQQYKFNIRDEGDDMSAHDPDEMKTVIIE